MLQLNDIRHEMAQFMAEHPRGSLDSALFYAVKLAYSRGFEDGSQSEVVELRELAKMLYEASTELRTWLLDNIGDIPNGVYTPVCKAIASYEERNGK